MKRIVFYLFFTFLLFLTSCAPESRNGQCSDDLCIKIQNPGRIEKNKPVPIEIEVKSATDRSEVFITLTVHPGATLEDVIDSKDVDSKREGQVIWKKKLQAGKEVKMIQNIRFPSIGDYSVSVMAVTQGEVFDTGFVVLITEEGGTAFMSGTPIPERTPAPLPNEPTLTWFPTYTATAAKEPKIPATAPSPTTTNTVAPYP